MTEKMNRRQRRAQAARNRHYERGLGRAARQIARCEDEIRILRHRLSLAPLSNHARRSDLEARIEHMRAWLALAISPPH